MHLTKLIAIGFFGIASVAVSQAKTDWQIGPWNRASNEPILRPSDATFTDPVSGKTVRWEKLHTFNPAAVVRNGKVYILYRAEDDSGAMKIGQHVSRLGLAVSSDGVHFTKEPAPVFYPAKDSQFDRENEGGTEDPRITEAEDGRYVLTYTQWSRPRHQFTVGVATSKDLHTWVKHGPIFAGIEGGKYDKLRYKSAGIVSTLKNGKLVAVKINGKYLMYWGEITVRVATSDDLVHWKPVEDKNGEPVVVMQARAGRFDSAFPEMGPPPVLTKHGIVVIYNGKNADPKHSDPNNPTKVPVLPGDGKLAAGTYAVGEALFDAHDPLKLLARTDEPVLAPEMPWESHGQYSAGTTFAEGLVWYNGKWLLYYGASDSFVGVAEAK